MTYQERSFPLVALLQMATLWAALAACIDGAQLRILLDRLPREEPIIWGFVAGVVTVGGVFGLFVGAGQIRMWRSAALGFVVGSLSGGIILSIYMAPAPIERALAAAVMLLLTTIALRWRTP
jgi:hypothetical protein